MFDGAAQQLDRAVGLALLMGDERSHAQCFGVVGVAPFDASITAFGLCQPTGSMQGHALGQRASLGPGASMGSECSTAGHRIILTCGETPRRRVHKRGAQKSPGEPGLQATRRERRAGRIAAI